VDGLSAGDRRDRPGPARARALRSGFRGAAGDWPRQAVPRAAGSSGRSAGAAELAPPRGRDGDRAAPGGEPGGAGGRNRAGRRTRAAARLDAPERSGWLMPAETFRDLESGGEGRWRRQAPGPGVVGDGGRARVRRQIGRGAAHPRPPHAAGDTRLGAGRAGAADGVRRDVRAARDGARGAADLGPEAGLAALKALHDRGELLDLADGRQTTRGHRTAPLARASDIAKTRSPRSTSAASQIRWALAGGLTERGGMLAPEQERAVASGYGDHQLVVIVGQAGDGEEHGAGRCAGARAAGAAVRGREHGRAGGRASRGRAARAALTGGGSSARGSRRGPESARLSRRRVGGSSMVKFRR
jgi:hypothetical protein